MIETLKKNRKGIILMGASSICVCTGQLFWKLYSNQYYFYFLMFGFLLYAIGALIMLFAYRFGELSVLQPMLSLNYVLSIVLAARILHEIITKSKLVGICFIIAGLICIASGGRK